MCELVADTESYPAFLPWCRSVRILSREGDEVVGTVEMVKGRVHKSFTTVNRLVKGERIDMELVEGPFKHLQGAWRFQPIGDQGCRVSLDLEFEFSNRLLAMTVGPVFSDIANRLVDAFTRRAAQLYGKR
jgi:ribosome-associated toxin RatA of RatAB toxin-antitoxin module